MPLTKNKLSNWVYNCNYESDFWSSASDIGSTHWFVFVFDYWSKESFN